MTTEKKNKTDGKNFHVELSGVNNTSLYRRLRPEVRSIDTRKYSTVNDIVKVSYFPESPNTYYNTH